MPNTEYAEWAVALAQKEAPEACLVQHTNFVLGRPCSDPRDIPSLVDENGMFYPSSKWRPENPYDTKCKGTVSPTKEDCKKETLAQMERFKELTGSYPLHFEGHSVGTQNVHDAFREVSEEMQIHSMVFPKTEISTMYYAHELLLDLQFEDLNVLLQNNSAEKFLQDAYGILKSKFELNILHFHPGYLDAYLLDHTSLTLPRCRDLATLCDPKVKRWLQEHQIELTDFKSVYKHFA